MLVVRCKVCNKELTGHETQSKCCVCPNMTTVTGEVVTAVDLSKVIMVQAAQKESKKTITLFPTRITVSRRKT